MRIESSSNPKIQRARRIMKRKEPGTLLIEGPTMIEEALAAGIDFQEVFATEEASFKNAPLIAQLAGRKMEIHHISKKLANTISDLETPPGLLAIVQAPSNPPVQSPRLSICLISVRDPGNVGTIIRTAEAAGCDALYHTPDCADPYQPKVIRSSMGSIFRLPLEEIPDPKMFLEQRRSNGATVCALASHCQKQLNEWQPVLPLILCVGSESHGLPEDLPVTEMVRIPMESKVESLNAGVAASIALYWVTLTCRNRN